MEIKDRVEALESEFKLIKGELKQTLASVRDYLIDLKLPPPDNAAMASIIEEESPLVKGEVTLATGAGGLPLQAEAFSPPAREPEKLPKPKQAKSGPSQPQWPEQVSSETELPEPAPFEPVLREVELSEEEMAEEELPETPEARSQGIPERRTQKASGQEINLSTPPVNLLANLIRWVANAKKTIGIEQLPVFLEVYGVSGHLSPELKEVILHLADITETQAGDRSAADIWSQLTLELHGILTGSDAPLHPLKPFWEDIDSEPEPEEVEAKEPPQAEKPFKLKLVLPGSDGKGKEFSISLNPECSPETGQEAPVRKPPLRETRGERL